MVGLQLQAECYRDSYRQKICSMPNMTGRPGYWTVETNGPSGRPRTTLGCSPLLDAWEPLTRGIPQSRNSWAEETLGWGLRQQGWVPTRGIPQEFIDWGIPQVRSCRASKGGEHLRVVLGQPKWRKFRAVPRLYPLRSLVCTLFNKGRSRRAFRLPGAGGGSFPLCSDTSARSYSVSICVRNQWFTSGVEKLTRSNLRGVSKGDF